MLLILLLIRSKKIKRLHQELIIGKRTEKAISIFGENPSSKLQWKVMDKPKTMALENEGIAFTKITIYPKKTLRNVAIEVQKPEFEPEAASSLEQEYDQVLSVKTNIRDSDIEKVVVIFRIEKKFKNVALQRCRNNKWKAYAAVFKGSDKKYKYYEAEISGFSYFATTQAPDDLVVETEKPAQKEIVQPDKVVKVEKVAKKEVKPVKEVKPSKRPTKKETSAKWPWILLILAILFLIMATMYIEKSYLVVPENVTLTNQTQPVDKNQGEIDEALKFIAENNLENSKFHLVWHRNTNLDIDLSQYLYDPDLDPLVFHATNPKNLTIDIEGSSATIIPDQDFYGVRNVNFAAADVNNEVGYTDEITLIVLNQDASVGQNALKYIKNILWKIKVHKTIAVVVLVILVIIILLIRFNKQIVDFFEEDKTKSNRKGSLKRKKR